VVRLRLQRYGRKARPFYRLAALDQRTRRNGRAIEFLGWFDPIADDPDKQIKLEEERIKYWLSVGAQPTETVRDLLAKRDLVDKGPWEAQRKRRRDLIADRKAKADAAKAAEEAAAAEAEAAKSEAAKSEAASESEG